MKLKLHIIALLLLAFPVMAVDVVLGRLSDLTWTGEGGDKVASFGVDEWTPLSIADCHLWLDATKETFADGATVTQWSDRSGNGNHATNGAASYVTMDVDGMVSKRAVRFTPVGDSDLGMLAPSLGLHASAQTIFVVAAADTDTSDVYRMIFSMGQHNTGLWLGRRGPTVQQRANLWNNATPAVTDALSWPDGAGVVVSCSTKSAANGTAYYQNGNLLISNTAAGAKANYTAGITHIGGMPVTALATARTLAGYMGEVIVYSRELSQTERAKVENYLMRKWGTP